MRGRRPGLSVAVSGEMQEECIFDVNLPQQYQEEGYHEGLVEGERKAYEEGFYLGAEEGERLGRHLGEMAGSLQHILTSSQAIALAEGLIRRIRKILTEIFLVSLTNNVDEHKGHRLLRIHGACRELCMLLPKELSTTLSLPPLNEFLLEGGGGSEKNSYDF